MPGTATPLSYCPLFIGRVQAGFPSPADDYIESRINLHEVLVTHPAETFYLKAGTDCEAAGVHKGDVLVVDRSVQPKTGRVAIMVEGGALRVQLIPAQSVQPLELWGVVTFIIRPTLLQDKR
jgi:DNA polymerase V